MRRQVQAPFSGNPSPNPAAAAAAASVGDPVAHPVQDRDVRRAGAVPRGPDDTGREDPSGYRDGAVLLPAPPPRSCRTTSVPSPLPYLSRESRLSTIINVLPAVVPLQLVHGTGWGDSVYVGFAQGVPRLNIPNLTLNDGPQGYRCNGLSICPPGTSTAFPSGLTIGASFDAGAAEAWGRAMGAEFYNKGANVQLGPGLCITRVPQGGRENPGPAPSA